MTKYLTIKEVAEKLNVSTKTVSRWVGRNEIPFIPLPGKNTRFDEGQIDSWLHKRMISSKTVGTV